MESVTYEEAITNAVAALLSGPIREGDYTAFDFAAIIGVVFKKDRGQVLIDIATFHKK